MIRLSADRSKAAAPTARTSPDPPNSIFRHSMKGLFRTPGSRLCAAYGPTLVITHYLIWIWGRFALGHWPRPSVDDPKDIPGLGFALLVISALPLLLPFAALIPLARAATSLTRTSRSRPAEAAARLTEAAISTTLLLASLLFLRHDPHLVASWLGD